jgi:hypothetical protein
MAKQILTPPPPIQEGTNTVIETEETQEDEESE